MPLKNAEESAFLVDIFAKVGSDAGAISRN
jgi:hypothetical protein